MTVKFSWVRLVFKAFAFRSSLTCISTRTANSQYFDSFSSILIISFLSFDESVWTDWRTESPKQQASIYLWLFSLFKGGCQRYWLWWYVMEIQIIYDKQKPPSHAKSFIYKRGKCKFFAPFLTDILRETPIWYEINAGIEYLLTWPFSLNSILSQEESACEKRSCVLCISNRDWFSRSVILQI